MSSLLTTWLLVLFASYALAYNIAYEVGPWMLFTRIRQRLLIYAAGPGREWVEAGVECPKCLGFWCCWLFALGWLAITPIGPAWLLYPVLACAAHGGLIALHWGVVALMASVDRLREHR